MILFSMVSLLWHQKDIQHSLVAWPWRCLGTFSNCAIKSSLFNVFFLCSSAIGTVQLVCHPLECCLVFSFIRWQLVVKKKGTNFMWCIVSLADLCSQGMCFCVCFELLGTQRHVSFETISCHEILWSPNKQ